MYFIARQNDSRIEVISSTSPSERRRFPPIAELAESKAGLVRSMKQYNADLVETFDNVDDLLADLHSPFDMAKKLGTSAIKASMMMPLRLMCQSDYSLFLFIKFYS